MEDFNQLNTQASQEFSPILMVVYLIVAVIYLAASWKIFVKAGRKGWEGIVPIYNIYILLKIVGKPSWWLILYFIPLANIYATIVVSIALAKAFGKDTVYGILLLWLLSIIGYPLLAFGKAKYVGVKPEPAQPSVPPAPQAPAAPPPASV